MKDEDPEKWEQMEAAGRRGAIRAWDAAKEGRRMPRRISEKGRELIKSFESFRDRAYFDSVGVLTIGYGSTGAHVKQGMRITKEEADALLTEDLSRFEEGVESAVKVALTDNQFSACVSLAFNIGLENFRKSTLLRLLNAKAFAQAAEQFLRWNRAGGAVLRGLTRRRVAEMRMFLGTEVKGE